MVSVDIDTTGFDLGRSGDNANSKTKTGTEGAESGSDQFHWFDLSGEAHCLVNTPSLKSTLITSTARVEEAVLFLRPGDQLKRANN